MAKFNEVAERLDAAKAELEAELGSRSAKSPQDMSHEQRTKTAEAIMNDHLSGIGTFSVRHMGTFDRVLFRLAERHTKFDK